MQIETAPNYSYLKLIELIYDLKKEGVYEVFNNQIHSVLFRSSM